MRAAIFLLIVSMCPYAVRGQVLEERARQVLSNLECKESRRAIAYEGFVDALGRGERGEGVRYPWMDKMRQFGIKQVFFVVHFEWKDGGYRYEVKSMDYLRRYYCYEDVAKSGKLLRQIRKSGLEAELKDAIIAKIRKYERPYRPEYVRSGESYHYLLDDESLPVIDFIT